MQLEYCISFHTKIGFFSISLQKATGTVKETE